MTSASLDCASVLNLSSPLIGAFCAVAERPGLSDADSIPVRKVSFLDGVSNSAANSSGCEASRPLSCVSLGLGIAVR